MESVSQSPEPETVSIEPQIVTCERLEISLNVDVLKQFVNELATLVDEAKVVFSVTDGLRARVVDPAHIAMIETGIALEVLESFDWTPKTVSVREEGYIAEIGIDVDKMLSYLKSLRLKDTVLKFSVDFEKRRMTIDAPTGQRVMPLIDTTGMPDPKVPTLDLPTEIAVHDQKAFRAQVRQAEEISDHIAIRYDSERNAVFLECEGDMDKMQSQVDAEIVGAGTSVRSLFPLTYLVNMVKTIPGPFHLVFGNDYPLKIEYGRTVYLLAPRIESPD